MNQPLDEKTFRERAYDLALGQLAAIFAEFFGVTGAYAKFENLATHNFMLQIAPAFAKFIDETAVEEITEEMRFLGKPSGQPARKFIIDRQRDRLEKAGLCRPADVST